MPRAKKQPRVRDDAAEEPKQGESYVDRKHGVVVNPPPDADAKPEENNGGFKPFVPIPNDAQKG